MEYVNFDSTLGLVDMLDFRIVSLQRAFDYGGCYLEIFYYRSELKHCCALCVDDVCTGTVYTSLFS